MLKTVSTGKRYVTIGELLQFPKVKDDTVVKSDTQKELGAQTVIMRCVVTDNRVGRLPKTDKGKDGNRFISLADFTAFMSIGMDASETGLKQYDLDEAACSETAALFFSAEVSGIVSWVPTKRKPDSATFFLNNGKVKKISLISWEDKLNLMFPTSDVCRMMAGSPFASYSQFHKTGFCGRVDVKGVNDEFFALISLEDPVGYAAVEVSFDSPERSEGAYTPDNTKDAEAFLKEKGVVPGAFLFLKGQLKISILDKNALKVRASEVEVEVVSADAFNGYVDTLLGTDENVFMGVNPEAM